MSNSNRLLLTKLLRLRPGTMTGGGKGPKEFYCTVFGQMDKSQTNLAVVLRTYFYPKEEFTGQLVSTFTHSEWKMLWSSYSSDLLKWALKWTINVKLEASYTVKHRQKHVEERWDDNPSFKIICNHEINSDPPSVMLCNPVRVKSKPGCQFRIDLLNQEAVSKNCNQQNKSDVCLIHFYTLSCLVFFLI